MLHVCGCCWWDGSHGTNSSRPCIMTISKVSFCCCHHQRCRYHCSLCWQVLLCAWQLHCLTSLVASPFHRLSSAHCCNCRRQSCPAFCPWQLLLLRWWQCCAWVCCLCRLWWLDWHFPICFYPPCNRCSACRFWSWELVLWSTASSVQLLSLALVLFPQAVIYVWSNWL